MMSLGCRATRLLGMLVGTALVLAAPNTAGGPGDAGTAGEGYTKDFEAFVQEVDRSYPFFDLKRIRKDWKLAKTRLAKRVRDCQADDEFLLVVLDAVRCLRDAHMSVRPRSGRIPETPKRYYPGLAFLPAEDRQVVLMHPPPGREATMKIGTVITKIDGKPAREFLEDRAAASWNEGGFFSSPQRARLFVYRIPLQGEKGDVHTLHYRDGGREKKVALGSDREVSGWPHTYNLPADLQRERGSFFFTRLPSGVGYMYWRRVDDTIGAGISRAVAAVPDAQGWIVDLRGNGGGGYDQALIDRMKGLPRPVAAILDAGCVSAGETVARDLATLADARLFGQPTAGSSTAKREWTFPSGIATVVFSTRSRSGIGGKPIEFNGIEPHVEVEAVPGEVLAGRNSEILRAEAHLLEQVRRAGSHPHRLR
ncbi:MAG: hypothetical protein JXQ29_17060 [Planctomycetes bacterium]|nr:hypothetical protein [Planctomycetota bacterium]